MEELYSKILSLETYLRGDVGNNWEYNDEQYRNELNSLLDKIDTKDYQKWKAEYLDSEFKKVKDCRLYICSYEVSDKTLFSTLVREDEIDDYCLWIKNKLHKKIVGIRLANEKEIKEFIGLHAADDFRD